MDMEPHRQSKAHTWYAQVFFILGFSFQSWVLSLLAQIQRFPAEEQRSTELT